MYDVRTGITGVIITVIMTSILYFLVDPNYLVYVTYLGSVLGAIYSVYRLFVREVENEVFRVYEEKIKSDIRQEVTDEVLRVYHEEIRPDIEKVIDEKLNGQRFNPK